MGCTQAAVKMHTLLDLRGSIPSFIHVSDGKLHDVHVLDLLLLEAWAIYDMDRATSISHASRTPSPTRRNQMTLPALTIWALYKSRWQVEVSFK